MRPSSRQSPRPDVHVNQRTKTTQSSGPKHAYLEREDGTPISTDERRLLSQKARAVWTTLISYNQAPKTWGKLSSIGWEFYARTMLNIQGLEILRLCDDGQWKLKEWSKHHYSGWALNNGIREPRPPKKEAKADTGSPSQDPLDDKGLFQIEPSTGEEPEETLHNADHVNSTDDRDQEQDNSDMGMSDREGDIAIPGASTARNTQIPAKPATCEIMQAKSIVVNPLRARPLARPVAKPVTDTIASRMPDATTKPPNAACASQTPKVTPPVHTQMEPIPDNMSIDTATPSVRGASSLASEATLPRLRLKLGPPPSTANIAPVEDAHGNPPPRAPPPAPVPTPDPSPVVQETSSTPDTTHNTRLEHALVLATKKRKLAEDKMPSNKKSKCTPTVLAIPPEGNTISDGTNNSPGDRDLPQISTSTSRHLLMPKKSHSKRKCTQ
ncbi:hypothetical protein EI94DRAFT_1764992 [Lactarius quietus]|nr:hypothetical protein EI94DRAFT_1764992 [Lactarius quietus]